MKTRAIFLASKVDEEPCRIVLLDGAPLEVRIEGSLVPGLVEVYKRISVFLPARTSTETARATYVFDTLEGASSEGT